MSRQKALPELMQVEELLRQDRFTGHKRSYDLHASAWLVAHGCDNPNLLRQSAGQMLFHLQKMYESTVAGGKMKHAGSAAAEPTKSSFPHSSI
jgi:hypothetical protein